MEGEAMKKELYFCDRCKKEIKNSFSQKYYMILRRDMGTNMSNRIEYKDLCGECAIEIYNKIGGENNNDVVC